MLLSKAQRAILFSIESNDALHGHFEVLCAALEAALDTVNVDPAKTNPHGTPVIKESLPDPVPLSEAAKAIAVAWIETIDQAIDVEGDTLSRVSFDEDGIPRFVDTRPLIEVGKACGFVEGHLRLALSAAREGSRTAPRRAMKIMVGLGKRIVKRKTLIKGKGRLVRLDPRSAHGFAREEVARAKAGSVYYSLVARKDGYEAVRVRKVTPQPAKDEDGDVLDIVGQRNIESMEGFGVPLMPCETAHETALAQFVQFLEGGRNDAPYTYQRLVHRAGIA